MEKENKPLNASNHTERRMFGSWAKPALIIMVIVSLITLTAYLIFA